MKIFDRALEWLKAEGYAPQQEENVLAVKYQGLLYTILEDQDPSLLKVDLAFPRDEFKNLSEEQALTFCNNTTRVVKVTQTVLYNDAVVFSYENFHCESDDLALVLPRAFELLGISSQFFFQQVNPPAEGEQK